MAANRLGSFAGKLCQDALLLIQRLWALVQRVRLAAAAIHAASEARAALRTAQAAAAPAGNAAAASPLGLLGAATSGAVAHLCHTLNDASGTLEAKWRALESTTTQLQSQLFLATHVSAQAMGAFGGAAPDDAGAAGRAMWAHESTAQVLEHEEALRLRVYAQVLAELNACASRGEGGGGYYAAA